MHFNGVNWLDIPAGSVVPFCFRESMFRQGRAIAQAVSRRFPTAVDGFKPGSGHVGFCDGEKWRSGRFSPRNSISPANLHSICFSTIIFTITRGWHNRPGVAAVPKQWQCHADCRMHRETQGECQSTAIPVTGRGGP
jgi:hypothetical protein